MSFGGSSLRSNLQLCYGGKINSPTCHQVALHMPAQASILFYNEVSIFLFFYLSNLTKCISCISPLHHMANASFKVCCFVFFAPQCFISAYCDRLSHLSIQQAPLKMEALKPMKQKPNFSTGFTGYTSRLVWVIMCQHPHRTCALSFLCYNKSSVSNGTG